MVVDFRNVFIIIYLAGTVLTAVLSFVLEAIDYKARKSNGGILPDILKKYPESEVFDEAKLKRITEYENAKFFAWIPRYALSFILKLALVLFGFYVFIYDLVISWFGEPATVGNTILCFMVFSILSGLPDNILNLPFNLHREFVLEKRFGFSNMTFKLWLADQIKSIIVSFVLMIMLISVASVLLVSCPTYWWAIIAVVLMVFMFIANIIYPKFIAPLFNKFQPLEDGDLKTRLEAMLAKAGFSSDGLFVMDASKRSKHSNAYFTGFGKAKRIVLYDTLIKSMTVDEIESVMAHEVGHYKLKHIRNRLIMMFPLILVGAFLLFKISHLDILYTGFGFTVTDINAMQFLGLELVMMVFSAVSMPLEPVTNMFSRKHEYQADSYSAHLCKTGRPLITALIKLNSENLHEILPPKIYSFFHYSHPTLVERTQALEAIENTLEK